jgi:hypothetical protein
MRVHAEGTVIKSLDTVDGSTMLGNPKTILVAKSGQEPIKLWQMPRTANGPC